MADVTTEDVKKWLDTPTDTTDTPAPVTDEDVKAFLAEPTSTPGVTQDDVKAYLKETAPAENATPARAQVYGPIVGEHWHDAMVGPTGNALGPRDVALSPNFFEANGGPYRLGQIVNVHKGDELLGPYRVGDYSYVKPGVPTFNTIELRDRNISGDKVTISPADGTPLPPPQEAAAPEPEQEQAQAQAPQVQTAEPGVDIGVTPPPDIPPSPTNPQRPTDAPPQSFLPRSGTQLDQEAIRQAGELSVPPKAFPMYWLGAAAEVGADNLGLAPDSQLRKAIGAYSGIQKGFAGLLSGATTPESGALLAVAPEGRIAQGLIAGGFLGQQIYGTPSQWKAFQDAPDIGTKAQIATQMAAGYILPALGLSHALLHGKTNLETTNQGGINASTSSTQSDAGVGTPLIPRGSQEIVQGQQTGVPGREGITSPAGGTRQGAKARGKNRGQQGSVGVNRQGQQGLGGPARADRQSAPDNALAEPATGLPPSGSPTVTQPAPSTFQPSAGAAKPVKVPVTPETTKAVTAPDTSAKKLRVQKAYLLDAVDKAIAEAPKEESLDEAALARLHASRDVSAPRHYESAESAAERAGKMEAAWQGVKDGVPTVQIEVPGDGTFTVVNTQEALKEFRETVKKRFPSASPKPTAVGKNARLTETKVAPVGKPKGPGDLVKVGLTAASGDVKERFVLTHAQSDGKRIVATDGRRALIIEGKAGGTEKNPVYYDSNGKQVKLKAGTDKPEAGNYPNVDAILPNYGKKNVVATLDTAAMQKLLTQAMEMTSERSNSVALWLDDKGRIGVTSHTPDVGEFAGGDADPATAKHLASYNPQFLLDGIRAARALGHDKVTLSLDLESPEMSPGVLDAKGVKYVLMPMRTGEALEHPLAKENAPAPEPTAEPTAAAPPAAPTGAPEPAVAAPVSAPPEAFPTSATAESVGNLPAPPGYAEGHLGIAPPGTRLIQRAIERTRVPRKRSQLDAATGEHSRRLQNSNAEAERTHKEIRGAAGNERVGNAMSIYREANGDENQIRQWLAQAKQDWFKQAATDALNLTPEQKAAVAKAASTFDVLEQRGNKYDILNAHRDNYVPHVWEVENNKTGFGSARLKDRFKFNKARTFDTFFDGDQAGFKPKTLDLANLLPAYMSEMNRVIADRQFVQGVSGSVGSDGRPLVAPQGNAKVVDTTDHIVRNADGSPLPKFQKARYDTLAEAQAALKPGQTIETRPSSSALVNPRGFAPLKDAQGDPINTSDYRMLGDQPALSNWRWIATDERGNTTMLKSDLQAHPELAKRIKAAMGESAIRKWYNEPVSPGRSPIPRAIIKNIDTAQAVMKREMFSLGGFFHQVQEGTHGIGHTVNPFGGMEDMSRPTAPMNDAMEHGLMLRSEESGSSRYMEGVGGRDSFTAQLAKKFGGKAGQAIADVINGYQDYLFNQYIPALKWKTYQHALERNLDRFAPELKSGEVTTGDIKQMTAEQINAAYGHLNHTLLDTDPTMQHFKQLVLLAPDFLEARGRFVGQAAKGLAGGKVGREQLRAVAVLAVAQAGTAYTAAQLIPGGKWDPKHPFDLTVNGRTYSLRSVPADVARLAFEGSDARREFVSARVNPLLQKGYQAVSARNYRGEKVDFADTIGEAIANYIPIVARSIPGVRSLTESGRNSPTSPLQQLAGSLGVRVSRYSPITRTYQLSSAWQKAQGLPTDTGVYPVSKYQQLRYALEDGDMDKANAEYKKLLGSGMTTGKVREGFRESLFKPFTPNRKTEAAFKKSLTGEDLAMYNEAVQRKQQIWHSFLFTRAK